jgi:4-amino-4-deoxy-L-arabinose transferase-like glycosyltransferase
MGHIAMITENQYQSPRAGLILLMQFLIVVLPLAVLPPIGSSSEAREVQVAWTILAEDQWVLPLRNGLVPSKPLLYHWLVAGLGLLIGAVGPELARIVSVLSAAAMLYLTIDLARFLQRYQGESLRIDCGVIAGFVLSTSYLFLVMAGNCRVDMIFAALTTAAVSVGIKGCISSRFGTSDLLLFSFFTGAATLAKGPLGIVLPMLIIAPSLLFVHGHTLVSKFTKGILNPGGIRDLISLCSFVILGLAVWALIVLPWYVEAIEQGGEAFVRRQLLFENLQRVMGSEEMNTKPWYYYGPGFLRSSFPWSLIWIYGLIQIFFSRRYPVLIGRSRVREGAVRVGYYWVLVGLVLFSLASGKRTSYLLPLLPGLAVAVGFWLAESLQMLRKPSLMRISVWIDWIAGCSFASVLLLWFALESFIVWSTAAPELQVLQASLLNFRIPCTAVLVVALASMLGAKSWFGVNLTRRFGSIQLGFFVLLAGGLYLSLCVRNDLKDFKGQAAAIRSLVPQSSPLVLVRREHEEYFDPLLMYLERPVSLVLPGDVASIDESSFIIARQRDAAGLISRGWISALDLNEPIDSARLKSENLINVLSPRMLASSDLGHHD